MSDQPALKFKEKVHRKPTVKTTAEQLALWVVGDSRHNSVREECCPDFSCCTPETLAPEKVRLAFVAASDEERMGMLGHFLAAGIAAHFKDEEPKVYVAGQGQPQ